MDEEKRLILMQGHKCLYNLQHKHFDNNLVKGNTWKEIAGEWLGSGRGTAWNV
jgi:5'(3')-deoxyribonucleotidase